MELDRIIRLRELLRITGLSTSSVYRMMAEGTFPRPVRLGKNSVGWRASDIQTWIASRPEVEDYQPPAPQPSRARSQNRGASRSARR